MSLELNGVVLTTCRYSIPPEHGKRLERLAKGNRAILTTGC